MKKCIIIMNPESGKVKSLDSTKEFYDILRKHGKKLVASKFFHFQIVYHNYHWLLFIKKGICLIPNVTKLRF